MGLLIRDFSTWICFCFLVWNKFYIFPSRFFLFALPMRGDYGAWRRRGKPVNIVGRADYVQSVGVPEDNSKATTELVALKNWMGLYHPLDDDGMRDCMAHTTGRKIYKEIGNLQPFLFICSPHSWVRNAHYIHRFVYLYVLTQLGRKFWEEKVPFTSRRPVMQLPRDIFCRIEVASGHCPLADAHDQGLHSQLGWGAELRRRCMRNGAACLTESWTAP